MIDYLFYLCVDILVWIANFTGTSYEFVNIWPTNMTSMRVAYAHPNVLQCNVQFAYDRFFTTFNYQDIQKQVVNTSAGIVNSKEQVSSNTYPDGFNFGKSTDDFSKDPRYQSTGGPNNPNSNAFKKKIKTSRGTRYR